MATVKLGKKRSTEWGSWSRTAEVGGRTYHCGVERGQKKRIAYKPRGSVMAYGFHWHGFVRDEDCHTLWSGRVSKSTGVRGLLICAGIIERPASAGHRVEEA